MRSSCQDSYSEPGGSGPRSRLRLAPFAGHLDFTNVLIVHSCEHVLVPNDTLAGLDVLEQIKFLNVGQLELQPHAFRGMRTAPRQLVVQDSHLPLLPSHAFAGLRRLEHLWLRNVTVGRVARMAFANVSDVQYVYFRNAAIQTLDAGAFGGFGRSLGTVRARESRLYPLRYIRT